MKILLVDDEPFALRILHEMIADAKESWEIVAAVEDGEEAIAVLQKQEIDFVISDIRMPAVDGLELSKYIRDHVPNVKVMLLTGYKDFKYAQQAIRYGVVDYLLKPSSFESLFESIEKIENDIMKKKSLGKLMQKRERGIVEKRLDDLLLGIPHPRYDDNLMPCFNEIFIVSCDLQDATVVSEEWDEIKAYTAVKNVAEEWFRTFGETYVIIQEQHVVIFVFLNNLAHEAVVSYKDMLHSFYETVQTLLQIDLFIGGGLPCRQLTELHIHYRESIRAMEDAKKNKFAPISLYGDVKQDREVASGIFEQKYEVKKNRRVIEIVLEKIENRLSEDLSLKVLAEEVYLNPTYLGRIFKEATGESFSQYLIRSRVERAKQLLMDPMLKVYEVCEQVGYSDPAHFTHVFKKLVGMTPQEYKMGM